MHVHYTQACTFYFYLIFLSACSLCVLLTRHVGACIVFTLTCFVCVYFTLPKLSDELVICFSCVGMCRVDCNFFVCNLHLQI